MRILKRSNARQAAQAAHPAGKKKKKKTRAPRSRSQAFIDATTKHIAKKATAGKAADPPEVDAAA